MSGESEYPNWDDVESVLNDLKADGYDPVIFKSDTSAAVEIKNFDLRVRRDSDEE